MRSALKWGAVLVGGIIVLSLLGMHDVAGVFGLTVMVAVIVVLLVRAARPGGGTRRARSINYLARYHPFDEHRGLPALVINAVAAAAFVDLLGDHATLTTLVVVFVLQVGAFIVAGRYGTLFVTSLGTIAVTVGVFTDIGCGEPVSPSGRVLFVVVLVVALLVIGFVRFQPIRLPRLLGGRLEFWEVTAVVFGLADLAAFSVHPAGLDVFGGAPGWAPVVLVALVAVIAALVAYAPLLVIGLLAVATAITEIALAVPSATPLTVAGDPCGSADTQLGYLLLFVVVGALGSAIWSRWR